MRVHLSWHVVSSEPPEADPDLPEQFQIRRDKRARLLEEGRDPYPVAIQRTHTLAEVRAAHPDLAIDSATDDIVGVAGRVIFARNSGKLCFATLQDGDGTNLQVMISLDKVGQEALDAWKADVDLGESGNEIDLVIEEMHRREAGAPTPAAGAAPPTP